MSMAQQDEKLQARLVRLSDTELTVADPAADVRGRTVVDKAGEEVGEVDALQVDDREHHVRFLRVASGGFLGLGATKFLLPVEAVTRINDAAVYVGQTRQHIADAPPYDPDLIHEEAAEGVYAGVGYYGGLYRHYGYPPYWAPGSVPPALSLLPQAGVSPRRRSSSWDFGLHSAPHGRSSTCAGAWFEERRRLRGPLGDRGLALIKWVARVLVGGVGVLPLLLV
jgi:sporulation protein YlmC with PRC-barrel domain